MKLSRKALRKMILNEIKKLNEGFTGQGPHDAKVAHVYGMLANNFPQISHDLSRIWDQARHVGGLMLKILQKKDCD